MVGDSPRTRVFHFQGTALRLVSDPAVRAADLRDDRVTVETHPDGRRFSVDAWTILGDLSGPLEPVGPPYSFRLLLEEILEAGFDDQWLAIILDWVRRLHLVALPEAAP